jgi:hypothetical protein
MPLTLTVKSTDVAAKRQREVTAHCVVDCLGHELPDRRLLCFLDDEEWQSFKDKKGIANRGFYSPVTATDRLWRGAPAYIREIVFTDGLGFDDFIYLHGSTCSSELGLTMTLAHELQHFFQHNEQAQLWAANNLIPNLAKTVSSLGLRCDIPREREARIVSKRAAEQIYGVELVRQYISGKIVEHVTEGDAADWECIRGLATSIPYDLARETKLFFRRLKHYRSELEQILRNCKAEYRTYPDVDLDALLSETGE